MHILFMNMSTVSNRKAQSFFTVHKDVQDAFGIQMDGEFSYIGQLEPVPMFLLAALGDKGLDQIVVLNTDATITSDQPDKVSDYDFFQERISRYCQEHQYPEPRFTSFVYHENLDGSMNDMQRQYIEPLKEAVTCLRDIMGPEDELYLDIHGGPRTTAYLDIAIMNLLRDEQIHSTMCFELKEVVRHKKYEIQQDHLSDDMIEFTVAMQSFLRYGRAEGLREYSNRQKMIDTEDSREFMNLVFRISDAISICDMGAFEREVKALKTELEKNRTYNGMIDIFKANIEKSYAGVLGNCTVADEVKWCRQKGFIQQAMSLIESRMPFYIYQTFFTDKSVYYDENRKKIPRSDEWTHDKSIYDKVCRGKDWESLETRLFSLWADGNFLIRYVKDENVPVYYVAQSDFSKKKEEGDTVLGKITDRKQQWEGNSESFFEMLVSCTDPAHLRGKDAQQEHLPMNQVISNKSTEYYLPSDENPMPFLQKITGNKQWKPCVVIRFELRHDCGVHYRRTLHMFLYLHECLVKYRNQIMHAADGERVSAETVRYDLGLYVRLLDELLQMHAAL